MPSLHRLILLRHAKSSWKDTSLPDDERPLARRGRRALPVVAKYLRGTGLTVELVLCSPAQRTRQTLDGVRVGLRGEPEVRIVREIYEATADELLEILHQVEGRYGSVLLIGHNPGMEELVDDLVSGGDEGALTRLREGFPT